MFVLKFYGLCTGLTAGCGGVGQEIATLHTLIDMIGRCTDSTTLPGNYHVASTSPSDIIILYSSCSAMVYSPQCH